MDKEKKRNDGKNWPISTDYCKADGNDKILYFFSYPPRPKYSAFASWNICSNATFDRGKIKGNCDIMS